MLNISKTLFATWNEKSLLYCHWKSNEHIIPGLNGDTDLDVLLSLNDKDAGETTLKSLNFLQCKSQYGSRYPGVDDWIGFDEKTGKFIHVHLHYHIVTGHQGLKEYNLPWTDLALESRIFDAETNVWTMEPNLEILTLYTRFGLKANSVKITKAKRGTFSLSNDAQKEVDWLKARVDWMKVQSLLDIYYPNYSHQMLGIIKSDSLDSIMYLNLVEFATNSFNSYRRTGGKTWFLKQYYFVVLRLRRKLRNRFGCNIILRKTPVSQKGLTISFLGQDGAGKTTVTNDILKWLTWKLDVRYCYLGSGDNYTSWKKKLLSIIPHGIIFKPLRAWLQITKISTLAKDVYKNIVNGEKYAAKGGIIIFDRYPQIEYEGINDGPKLRSTVFPKLGPISKMFDYYASKEEKFLKKAVSHYPEIVFKLVIPPEESVKRKPENKLEDMVIKHNIIKNLDFEYSDVYVIDATMPYNEEIIMIKNIIWQHIQK